MMIPVRNIALALTGLGDGVEIGKYGVEAS